MYDTIKDKAYQAKRAAKRAKKARKRLQRKAERRGDSRGRFGGEAAELRRIEAESEAATADLRHTVFSLRD